MIIIMVSFQTARGMDWDILNMQMEASIEEVFKMIKKVEMASKYTNSIYIIKANFKMICDMGGDYYIAIIKSYIKDFGSIIRLLIRKIKKLTLLLNKNSVLIKKTPRKIAKKIFKVM